MKYFIEISSWNLLESFVTESISPFSFYQERNFGNNLSRYLSGDKERTNHLILSEKDLGGDYSICVDESLIDSAALCHVKGLKTVYTYPKSIYYRPGLVHFRFASNELKDSLIAESAILLEVKCLEKYTSSFYIAKVDNVERKGISKLDNLMSFDKASYINYDNTFNKIKGAIVGYVRGLYTSSDESNQLLQTKLKSLKNSFGGFNTQIMMSDHFSDDKGIIDQISKCKNHYFDQIEQTNSFDVLSAQYYEIVKLATLRSEELLVQKSSKSRIDKDYLITEKTSIENEITNIEKSYNIYNVRSELDSIKSLEKSNGQVVGKTRQYFKKGTLEYERKKQLKRIIDDFENNNQEYLKLQTRLQQIEQELYVDANMQDSVLSALFIRVSDILNELIEKASSVTSNNIIDLSKLFYKRGTLSVDNPTNNPEICYFNILLQHIMDKTAEIQLSEYSVLELLVDSAKAFKGNSLSKSTDGEKILNYLRSFLLYKNQKLELLMLPEYDMPVLQSIFSFFVKPLGYEQIERYMLLKKFQQKQYAFMLWGAWIGYADMPKTFTNVIYQNEEISRLIDNLFPLPGNRTVVN